MDLHRTVAEVAALVGGRVEGDGGRRLSALRALERAGPDDLAALFDASRLAGARACGAAALLVPAGTPRDGLTATLIEVEDAEAAVDAVAAAWGPVEDAPGVGVHPRACVDPGAEVDPTACVGPLAFVGPGAVIGAGAVLWPGAFVGAGARVGEGCRLHPGAVLGARCVLGRRVVLHAQAVVGADGFGYRLGPDGVRHKSPQVGIVRIGDDAELGACVTVDRARLEETVIGEGVKLDDHVHVAHNCRVGDHTVIAGNSVLAGSCTLGRHVMMGGISGVREGCSVGDGAVIHANTSVWDDVAPGGRVQGVPAVPHRQYKRDLLNVRRLARWRAQGKGVGDGA